MSHSPTVASRHDHRVLAARLRDDLAVFDLETGRLHLLDGPMTVAAEPMSSFAPSGPPEAEPSMPPVRRGPQAAPTGSISAPSSGSFAALDARVGIVGDDEEIVAMVAEVFAPLHCADPPDVAIEIEPRDDAGWTVRIGDRSEVTLGSRLSVVLRVIAAIDELAVASVPADLVLHGGAVTDGNAAVVLPAAAHHGTSTLTTALTADGLRYLTDEIVAIGDGLVVRPFSKSVALFPGSFPLFPSLRPTTVDGLARAMASREWHIDPRQVGDIGRAAPVNAIVCAHWRAGASTRLTRLDPVEALHLLVEEAYDFTIGGQPVFERLVTIVDTVPVFRLGYGDLDEAVSVVRDVVSDPNRS